MVEFTKVLLKKKMLSKDSEHHMVYLGLHGKIVLKFLILL